MSKSLAVLLIACATSFAGCATDRGTTSQMGNSGTPASSAVDRGASGTSTSGEPLTNMSTGSANPMATKPATGQGKAAQ